MEANEMMRAARERYQKEVGRLDRCAQLAREMKERGDASSKDRDALGKRMWKTKSRLYGMRSMAKAVGIDPSALTTPEGRDFA